MVVLGDDITYAKVLYAVASTLWRGWQRGLDYSFNTWVLILD
jgi:hypothetical protein